MICTDIMFIWPRSNLHTERKDRTHDTKSFYKNITGDINHRVRRTRKMHILVKLCVLKVKVCYKNVSIFKVGNVSL